MKKDVPSFSTPSQWISVSIVLGVQAILALALLSTSVLSHAAENRLSGDSIPTGAGDLTIHPINHASFLIAWGGKTIYVDPVGGAARFAAFSKPDVILITDIHGDHLNADTLTAITTNSARILAPSAVVELMPQHLRKRATVI